MKKSYLITGVAGFIGFFSAKALLERGESVIGIDSINDYYDVKLKHARLAILEQYESFQFSKGDISNKEFVVHMFDKNRPDTVVHLAAQAGVRYSLVNPDAYINSNIVGFYNILEACRSFPVKHLIYASSSSVYGANKKVPFEETDFVDHPISLYAATKKSNELMAYAYSHLYQIPATGLRFFTVYGPWGRPDMAYYSFAEKYFKGEPIHIFNNGDMENDLYRDFTYIDDVVDGIIKLINRPPSGADCTAAHKVFNVGNNRPEKLMDFIYALETALSNATGERVEFKKVFEPLKPGDVPVTYASIDALYEEIYFGPTTTIEEGLRRFAEWYVRYRSESNKAELV
ncbi:MAG: GDP-mannose 4,6-dehydratase [Dehalococcoidales bacterium]